MGSANWITDTYGNPIQYIHYAPYGELIENQTKGYDERYKFTGKERDKETGYDAFGARSYWSIGGIFTSVDQCADDYPGITPYAYCANNPIRYVDPDGRDWYEAEDGSAVFWKNSILSSKSVYEQEHNYFQRITLDTTMRQTIFTLLIACTWSLLCYAQTPYDSFAPEAYRPMLELETPTNRQPDTIFSAVVADLENRMLLLMNVHNGEILAAIPLSDDISKWLSVDPLADKYPNISPYAYCAWNPINKIDPNGMWSVSVTASENRGKNPYAMFQVYDNKNNLIYRTIVKVTGKHRDRTKTSGDTPTGKYKILEWRETGNKDKERYYNPESYGPNDLLALEYAGEEGKGRQGMHVHGGRDQKNLWNTEGCIRIADDDIAELKQLTDMLEAIDPTEHGTTLEVQNNLNGSLQYSRDKEEYKYNLMTEGYLLPEIIVTPTY